MTDAEFHQQTLEQREQSTDVMRETIRTAVVGAQWDAPIALVETLRDNKFTVIDYDGNRYTVTIEEQ